MDLLLSQYFEAVDRTEELNMYMSNIGSVCGIACNIYVKMFLHDINHAHMVISIESLKLIDGDGASYEYISLPYDCSDTTKLEELLKKVKADISGLTYCPLTCVLKKATPESVIEKFWDTELFNIHNIQLKPREQCCVCLCDTFCTTDCGHYLCVPCGDKIEGNPAYPAKCPICRQGNVHVRG